METAKKISVGNKAYDRSEVLAFGSGGSHWTDNEGEQGLCSENRTSALERARP